VDSPLEIMIRGLDDLAWEQYWLPFSKEVCASAINIAQKRKRKTNEYRNISDDFYNFLYLVV
jgi:hypothetical protein